MLTGKLRSTSAHDSNETGHVDDASSSLKSLRWVGLVVAHREDGVFRAVPDTFDVDVHCEIPRYSFMSI